MTDLAWASVRMTPLMLFEVDISSIREANSSWMEWLQRSYSLMCSCSEKKSGCCPMIDASSAEFSTVYTVMKNVKSMHPELQ